MLKCSATWSYLLVTIDFPEIHNCHEIESQFNFSLIIIGLQKVPIQNLSFYITTKNWAVVIFSTFFHDT